MLNVYKAIGLSILPKFLRNPPLGGASVFIKKVFMQQPSLWLGVKTWLANLLDTKALQRCKNATINWLLCISDSFIGSLLAQMLVLNFIEFPPLRLEKSSTEIHSLVSLLHCQQTILGGNCYNWDWTSSTKSWTKFEGGERFQPPRIFCR